MRDAVAIATLLAIVATVVRAGQQVKIATRAVELSREGVEAAHRPVIVAPEPERVAIYGEGEGTRPVHDIDFPALNIGNGPTLNVTGECAAIVGGQPWGKGLTPAPVNIAADATETLTFTATEPEAFLRPHPGLVVALFYEDLAGRRYWTRMHLTSQRQGYRCEVGEGPMPDDRRVFIEAEQPQRP